MAYNISYKTTNETTYLTRHSRQLQPTKGQNNFAEVHHSGTNCRSGGGSAPANRPFRRAVFQERTGHQRQRIEATGRVGCGDLRRAQKPFTTAAKYAVCPVATAR